MLPVWMLTTLYNGQSYTFAMNGQSGKVTGNLPIDSGESTSYFMKTAGISFVILEVIAAILGLFNDPGVVTAVIGGLIIALIIAAIALSSAKSSMVAHTKSEASHYFVKQSFKLTRKEDRYVGTREEKISDAPQKQG